jgi:hypothetical protein
MQRARRWARSRPLVKGQRASALGLAVVTVALTPVAASASDSQWYLPYPFGTNIETPGASDTVLSGPRRNFKGVGPMGSYARFTKMHWRGWGRDTAVGRGYGQYCDGGCRRTRRIRVTLTDLHPICDTGRYSYLHYRLANFKPFFSRTLASGSPPDC